MRVHQNIHMCVYTYMSVFPCVAEWEGMALLGLCMHISRIRDNAQT